MRIIRYQTASQPATFGWVKDDKIGIIEGSPFSQFSRAEANILLEEVAAHAAEHDAEVPEIPLIFLKPPSTVIPHGGTILLPPQSQQVEHEGELAVVIGKTGRWIAAEEAHDYIFGFTIANDVSARDLQFRDGQWTRGKGFDTFCPLGPWIETDFDPADAVVTCHVNEEMRQMASTKDMVFSVRQLITFTSSVMTLFPGDLLLTGTPAGVNTLQDGDVVDVSIEGIGKLSSKVANEPAH
jgi:2-keto-4-pentenoate hydratase/2-oxohepta-3-ene-1,7-dioic acid hydratase in catechol pathway